MYLRKSSAQYRHHLHRIVRPPWNRTLVTVHTSMFKHTVHILSDCVHKSKQLKFRLFTRRRRHRLHKRRNETCVVVLAFWLYMFMFMLMNTHISASGTHRGTQFLIKAAAPYCAMQRDHYCQHEHIFYSTSNGFIGPCTRVCLRL